MSCKKSEFENCSSETKIKRLSDRVDRLERVIRIFLLWIPHLRINILNQTAVDSLLKILNEEESDNKK